MKIIKIFCGSVVSKSVKNFRSPGENSGICERFLIVKHEKSKNAFEKGPFLLVRFLWASKENEQYRFEDLNYHKL